ncbi:hypothetical protein GQ457_16G016490 [Hibiscus cannabinus]
MFQMELKGYVEDDKSLIHCLTQSTMIWLEQFWGNALCCGIGPNHTSFAARNIGKDEVLESSVGPNPLPPEDFLWMSMYGMKNGNLSMLHELRPKNENGCIKSCCKLWPAKTILIIHGYLSGLSLSSDNIPLIRVNLASRNMRLRSV